MALKKSNRRNPNNNPLMKTKKTSKRKQRRLGRGNIFQELYWSVRLSIKVWLKHIWSHPRRMMCLRIAAVEIHGLISNDSIFIRDLLRDEGERHPDLATAAIHALGNTGSCNALDPLTRFIDVAAEENILPLIKAIGKIKDKRGKNHIKRFLAHSNPDYRAAAAKAFKRMGDDQWKRIVKGKDADIKNIAALKTREAFEILLLANYYEKNESNKKSVLDAIRDVDGDALLKELRSSGDDRVRKEATYALGLKSDKSGLTALYNSVDDCSCETSITALRMLTQYGQSKKTTNTMLYALLGSQEHVKIAVSYLKETKAGRSKFQEPDYSEKSISDRIDDIRELTDEKTLDKIVRHAIKSKQKDICVNALSYIEEQGYAVEVMPMIKKCFASNDADIVDAAADAICTIVRHDSENAGIGYLQESVKYYEYCNGYPPQSLLYAMIAYGDEKSNRAVIAMLQKHSEYNDAIRLRFYKKIGGEIGLQAVIKVYKKNKKYCSFAEDIAEAFVEIGDERGLPYMADLQKRSDPQKSIYIHTNIRKLLERNPGTTILSKAELDQIEEIEDDNMYSFNEWARRPL